MKKKGESKLIEAFYYGQFKQKKTGFFDRLKKVFNKALARLSGSGREFADTAERESEINPSYGTGPERRLESLQTEVARHPGGMYGRIAKGVRKNVVVSSVAVLLILIIVVFGIAYVGREISETGPRLQVEKKSESREVKERNALGKKVEKLELKKVEPVPPTKDGKAAAPPAEVFAYKIRVITLPSRYANSVEKIVAFFKANGIEAVSRKTSSGKHIVIYAGLFVDAGSAECRALLKQIRSLEYEGKRSFKSAYVVKVR